MTAAANWVEICRTCNLPEERRMDPVSRWLIITRACVFPMTFFSVAIGGLLAALDGAFSPLRFALVVLGTFVAHAANNMVNDLYDVRGGVDTADYPRAKYAPHPLLDGMVTEGGLIRAILVCNVLDLAIALYFTAVVGWTVMYFALAGLALSVFYVAPPLKLKHRGLGEPAIFLIWGPLITGGTYFALAGAINEVVFACTVPYGLAVTAVLMGKHMDKAEQDRAKGVRSLPVILGPRWSTLATQLMVWGYYLSIVALVGLRWLPWPALAALASLPHATRFLIILSRPMPATPEEAYVVAKEVIPRDLRERFDHADTGARYPLWPLWFVAWGVWWVRLAGGFLAAGLGAAWLMG